MSLLGLLCLERALAEFEVVIRISAIIAVNNSKPRRVWGTTRPELERSQPEARYCL